MKLLFVDDERQVLQGLKRMISCWEQDWEIDALESGAEALEAMERKDYDVVVTDMRMPGMDGAELLNFISVRHPNVIRIVLSGHASNRAMVDLPAPDGPTMASFSPSSRRKLTSCRIGRSSL